MSEINYHCKLQTSENGDYLLITEFDNFFVLRISDMEIVLNYPCYSGSVCLHKNTVVFEREYNIFKVIDIPTGIEKMIINLEPFQIVGSEGGSLIISNNELLVIVRDKGTFIYNIDLNNNTYKLRKNIQYNLSEDSSIGIGLWTPCFISNELLFINLFTGNDEFFIINFKNLEYKKIQLKFHDNPFSSYTYPVIDFKNKKLAIICDGDQVSLIAVYKFNGFFEDLEFEDELYEMEWWVKNTYCEIKFIKKSSVIFSAYADEKMCLGVVDLERKKLINKYQYNPNSLGDDITSIEVDKKNNKIYAIDVNATFYVWDIDSKDYKIKKNLSKNIHREEEWSIN